MTMAWLLHSNSWLPNALLVNIFARISPRHGITSSFTTSKIRLMSALPNKKVAYNYGPLTHNSLSKNIWNTILLPGDIVIDATCGNGNDSLFIGESIFRDKTAISSACLGTLLYCIDVQKEAVSRTKEKFRQSPRFKDLLDSDCIKVLHQSHETLPSDIHPESVKLICYNLGYLPGIPRPSQPSNSTGGTSSPGADSKGSIVGTNKPAVAATPRQSPEEGNSVTCWEYAPTSPATTIPSLDQASRLIKEGGLLSVTAYTGHPGGDAENEQVREFMSQLDPDVWRVYSNVPLNRPQSPILYNAFKIEKFGYVKTIQNKK